MHLEFSLKWISVEVPLEYLNLYLVSNSERKETFPDEGYRGLVWVLLSLVLADQGYSYLEARKEGKVDWGVRGSKTQS